MPEPDRTIQDRIATDLADVGVKDAQLVQELISGVPGSETGDLDAATAAEVAMSVLRAVDSLPQPTEEEVAAFPPSGEIRRLRALLAEARQDPRNLEHATGRDLLRALLGPRTRRV